MCTSKKIRVDNILGRRRMREGPAICAGNVTLFN